MKGPFNVVVSLSSIGGCPTMHFKVVGGDGETHKDYIVRDPKGIKSARLQAEKWAAKAEELEALVDVENGKLDG